MALLPTATDIIQDVVANSNRDQTWWAKKLGYSLKHFNQVYNGRKRVTVEFAVRFERASHVSARGLLRLQADLDLRNYLLAGTERNGARKKTTVPVVAGPGELAGSPLDRSGRQPGGGMVRNSRPTRYTGGR